MFRKDTKVKTDPKKNAEVLASKKLSTRIKDEMKFTGMIINDIRLEIDRMTQQNKLLYDEVKKTNETLENFEKRIAKIEKSITKINK